MRAQLLSAWFMSILLTGSVALALSPGRDVMVAAAARSGPWTTDLYVLNTGTMTVPVTVSWLVRGQANPDPESITFDLLVGETAILEDVIGQSFGITAGGGAFRIEADDEVVVSSRIYASDGSSTFGQGFAGVPVWAATTAGQTTGVVGLTHGIGFRTNVYALAGDSGASISFSLRDPSGAELSSATLQLAAWEPYLKPVDDLFPGLASFEHAALHAVVTSGSVVVGASKVDNASTDPTTLESSVTLMPPTTDGTYQISTYDSSSFAGGGNIVVVGDQVTEITATYFNWDRQDVTGVIECTEMFLVQTRFDPPVDLSDFASGVAIEQVYESGAVMSYTVTMSLGAEQEITGTVSAVGSGFPLYLDGCNGVFPELTLLGGKGE